MIWQVKEWESESGWHCNCVDDLANNSAAWWLPARVLGISPADFIKLLLTKYKPDEFYFNPDTCFCCWSWKSQSQMRLYKNWINRIAREKKFEI